MHGHYIVYGIEYSGPCIFYVQCLNNGVSIQTIDVCYKQI